MRLLTLLLSLLVMISFQNCSNSEFSAADGGITPRDVEPPVLPPDPVPPIVPPNPECPRYELIIDSEGSKSARENYRFHYNAEMEQKSNEGVIELHFAANSTAKPLVSCSGSYKNTLYGLSYSPLEVAEELVAEAIFYHGPNCSLPPEGQRRVYFKVKDVATNKVLFDDRYYKDRWGCNYQYTAEGELLFDMLLDLSDSIANDIYSSCF